MSEPTELDKARADCVRQIIEAVRDPSRSPGATRQIVEELLMEWGAKTFQAGRKDLADVVVAMTR